MRALQHLGGLLDGGEKAERARDKRDVVINGFWYPHHRERVTTPLGFLKEFPGPALRTITADGEENIDATTDQILHSPGLVHWAAGGTQNCAASQMDCIHQPGREGERFVALFRIQPLISPAEAEHLFYTVSVMQFEEQRSDYIVESGAQSSASNNPGASFRRVKEKIFARTCQFKEEVIGRTRVLGTSGWGTNVCVTNDCYRNTLRIANKALQR